MMVILLFSLLFQKCQAVWPRWLLSHGRPERFTSYFPLPRALAKAKTLKFPLQLDRFKQQREIVDLCLIMYTSVYLMKKIDLEGINSLITKHSKIYEKRYNDNWV